MTALRAGLALCAVALAGCAGLLGVHDATSDGEPVALAFTSANQGVAQQPLDVITVEIQDIQGKPTTKFTGEVVLALGNNPGGAALLGALTATATDGTARFDAVGIDKPGLGYTLVASAVGLPAATSSAFDVVVPRFKRVATGIPGASISSIVVSPAPAGGTATVFASAADGVYKSTDRGASWKPASFGADVASLLLADPNQPGVVYLLHGGSLKKTVDGGASWHEVGVQAKRSSVSELALDPKNSSVIYILRDLTTLRSTDGGASWTELAVGAFCYHIVVDAVTADTVYCVAYDLTTHASLGVYRSSNAGATWGTANAGLGSLDVASLVATPNAMFTTAGGMLFRSIDAATSWTSVYPSFGIAVAYAPSMPNRIYLSHGGAISVSNDGGASFGSPVITNEFMSSVAVDPTNPDVVYGATGSGVLISTDGGIKWSPSSNGLDAHRITSVALAPGTSETVLTTTTTGPVLRSSNGGTSWTTVSQVTAIAHFDPTASTRVYLCGSGYFATSNNGGASFTDSTGDVLALGGCERLEIAGTKFFAVGAGGMFKSTDSGAHWTGSGLGAGVGVTSIALGDATGDIVVAATQSGVFRSADGGASFTQLTSDSASGVVADPKVPAHVVVGKRASVLVSSDAGATFLSVATPNLSVQPLSSVGSALAASGIGFDGRTSLLTSTDGGSSWTPVDISGLPRDVSITSIAASDDGATLYLGTAAGLYKGAGR